VSVRPPRSPPASSPAVAAAMRGNKRAGTRPEMIVRRLLHGLGYRFRTQGRGLPGKPDLVLSKRRTVVQVHGCFWHQHDDPACPLRAKPRSNLGYWDAKLARNAERDTEQAAALEALGWRAITVWECDCRDPEALGERLAGLLGAPRLGDH
jgi:DNA mismatch endonuclease (patch repair protein)